LIFETAEDLSQDQLAYAASDVLYLHKLKEKMDQQLEQVGRVELARKCFNFLPTRAQLDLDGWGHEDIFHH
jgi:ribonuclease D